MYFLHNKTNETNERYATKQMKVHGFSCSPSLPWKDKKYDSSSNKTIIGYAIKILQFCKWW